MAYHAEPAGEVWVDQGAASALREKEKSLLPVGIVRVEGSFGMGALVRILDFQGQTIGVGLSNYKAADLKQVIGMRCSEVEELLGADSHREAIHRDNMLLDAAI